jgi:hypothetical protein
MVLAGEGVEQDRVHVVADAEGEEADVVGAASLTLSMMRLMSISPSVGRPSVRKRIIVGRSDSTMPTR